MSRMTVSLTDELRAYVDKQVQTRGYDSDDEYIRDLIRRQRDQDQFRQALLEGATSPVVGVFDAEYFQNLREQFKARAD